MEGHTSLSPLSWALGTYFLCSRPHPTGWCWFITTTPFLHPQTHRAQISLWACGSPQLSSTWQPRSGAHRAPAEPASQASAPAPPPGPQEQSAVTTCLLCTQHARPAGGPGQAEQPRTRGEARQTALSQPGPRGPHSHPARLTGASPLAKSLQGLHSGTRSRPQWSQQAPALTSTDSDIPEANHTFYFRTSVSEPCPLQRGSDPCTVRWKMES